VSESSGMDWNGQRVLIIGAARQGQALARYLGRHGAQVILNDRRGTDELHAAQSALADLPVRWAAGGHPLELLDEVDLVCLSGGVPLTLPLVVEAVRRGMPLSNDTQIFLQAAPCPTVGITGSAGKTTTTSLVGRMAEQAWQGRAGKAWIGGNIGDPLLNYLDEMGPNDLAVLEISSFQLEQTTVSPNVAAVLNITPNHLDRHGTMEAYTAAKARILDFQGAGDSAVLGFDDPGAWGLRGRVRGRLVAFGMARAAEGPDGAWMQDNRLMLREQGRDIPLADQGIIHLRGEHNRQNVLAACAIARAAGIPVEVLQAAIESFHGVPHRLEFVREWQGAAWYNDSIATAPERTMAAVRAFDETLVLLLGGRDKDLPWGDLATLVRERVDHVVLFGEAAGKIAEALGDPVPGRRPFTIARCEGLRAAVQAAAQVVQPGDVVLLSPGGTSFDEFRDFEERGEAYRSWLQELS